MGFLQPPSREEIWKMTPLEAVVSGTLVGGTMVLLGVWLLLTASGRLSTTTLGLVLTLAGAGVFIAAAPGPVLGKETRTISVSIAGYKIVVRWGLTEELKKPTQ